MGETGYIITILALSATMNVVSLMVLLKARRGIRALNEMAQAGQSPRKFSRTKYYIFGLLGAGLLVVFVPVFLVSIILLLLAEFAY
ncbi:hypothetical protein LJC63_11760 [Ruminococcaceae bacterium OttesenSCG-928-L11]|nr:hypothetical protein [Ruminococcaceae bacterium OttesenSCG-928-L11]